MQNFTKKILNISLIAIFLVVPNFVSAQYSYDDYSFDSGYDNSYDFGYDDYSYDNSYDYSYDDYSFDSGYDNSYDFGYDDYSYDYDYGYDDYSYDNSYDYSYDDYSFDSGYDNSYDFGYDDYSYDYDYGYDDYSYDNSYDYSYDDYSFDSGYDNSYDFGYDDYSYDNSYDYSYDDYSFDSGYDNSYDFGYDDYSYDNSYDYSYDDYSFDSGYDNSYDFGYDDYSYDYDYGYDDYSYDNSYDYSYDDYSFDSGYDNSYDFGYDDYSYDNSYDYSYDDYSFDSGYDNSYDFGYDDYSYDYDYGYDDYNYDYDYGYDDYSYDYDYGYDDYSYDYDYGYDDYNYDYDYGYDDYSYDYDYGYDDYNYDYDYGYDDYSYDYDYGYDDYSYDYDYGYDDYNYDYDYGYDDYNYDYDYGYDDYSYDYDYGYDDYNYDYDYGYDDYNYDYDYGYDDYSYDYDYGYDDYNYDYDYGYDDYNYDYDYGYDDYSYDYDYGYDDYNYDYDYGDWGYDYDWDYDWDWDYDGDCQDCDHTSNIRITCSVSDRTLEEGDSATFTANATGGTGSYTYLWSGDISGTSRTITRTFNNEGIYYASIRVTDNAGRSRVANCDSVEVENDVIITDPLVVSCSVSDRTLEEGDSATFTANATGGTGSYTYLWSGDISGTSRTITRTFNNEGIYYASIRVTDNAGRSRVANCDSVEVENDVIITDPLVVSCSVSDRTLEEGDSATFTANATGGTGSYTYLWSGDISGTSRTITRTFNNEGIYYASIRVTDNAGRSRVANCDSVEVENDVIITDPLVVSCSVSDRTLEEGDSATFTANATGGTGSYTYLWSGDISGTSRTITRTFNNEGIYYASIRVTDNAGRSRVANCDSVEVENDVIITDPLVVSCSVSDRTLEEGDSATFTANATGGTGSYTYLWSGDISGTSRTITRTFNNEGIYYASIRVTDNAGRSRVANCDSVQVEEEQINNDDLEVSCRVSDTSIEEGDTVRFTAEVTGGNSPYEYDWSGDVNEDERTFTTRFNREGRYEVEVRVRDDEGRIARDTCSTIRVDGDNNNNDDDQNISSGILSSGSNIYPTTPTGNLASVGSVYLNQVPYTGPEDIAKGIAFVIAILAWSIIGALIIKNRMAKKAISNRVAAFKEANKATRN